jgi:hypothetical protein
MQFLLSSCVVLVLIVLEACAPSFPHNPGLDAELADNRGLKGWPSLRRNGRPGRCRLAILTRSGNKLYAVKGRTHGSFRVERV